MVENQRKFMLLKDTIKNKAGTIFYLKESEDGSMYINADSLCKCYEAYEVDEVENNPCWFKEIKEKTSRDVIAWFLETEYASADYDKADRLIKEINDSGFKIVKEFFENTPTVQEQDEAEETSREIYGKFECDDNLGIARYILQNFTRNEKILKTLDEVINDVVFTGDVVKSQVLRDKIKEKFAQKLKDL